MNLKKMLDLWQKNTFITQEQADNIQHFMKERQKTTFFRFLKWIAIIGALNVVVGGIVTLYNLFKMDFIQKIIAFFSRHLLQKIWFFLKEHLILPIHNLVTYCFGDNSLYFYLGLISSILFTIFNILADKTNKNKQVDKLNLSSEQKNILKSNYIFYTIAAVSLAAAFYFFNMLIVPENSYWDSQDKFFPIFNVLGAITFIVIAYIYSRSMYLLFGILFIALSVGMFSGYSHACYWIGVSRPIIQIIVSVVILLAGYITSAKFTNNKNDYKNYIQERFAFVYNWTGLLMLFLALWIASLWGFRDVMPSDTEIILANVIFIATSIGTMCYGAKTESTLFFNYGLTFLIIEIYTLFFTKLWDFMSYGVAILSLGILLTVTSIILKKIYIKKVTTNQESKN